MKILIQHKIQAGFAAALVFLLLVGATAWWSEQQNVTTFRSLDHTHRVNDTLDEMLVELLNVETGNRGFAISGDDAFLHPYQAGIIAVPKAFATAKRMMEENPRQQKRLTALEQLIQEELPIIHLVNDRAFMVVRKDIQGLNYNGLPFWGLWNIDEVYRK